jgi:hypothetical protein
VRAAYAGKEDAERGWRIFGVQNVAHCSSPNNAIKTVVSATHLVHPFKDIQYLNNIIESQLSPSVWLRRNSYGQIETKSPPFIYAGTNTNLTNFSSTLFALLFGTHEYHSLSQSINSLSKLCCIFLWTLRNRLKGQKWQLNKRSIDFDVSLHHRKL